MLFWLIIALSMTDVGIIPIGNVPITPFLLLLPFAHMVRENRPTASADAAIIGIKRAFCALVALMAVSVAANIGHAKPTSVAYSAIFASYAWYLTQTHHAIGKQNSILALKAVLIIYFIFTASTWLLSNAGISTEAFSALLKRVWDPNSGKFRFQGLSSEPSYAAIIVVASYVGLIRLSAIRGQQRIFWSAIVLIQLMMFSSAYGYLLFFLSLFMEFWNQKKRSLGKYAIPSIGIIAVFFIISGAEGGGRLANIITSISSLDLGTWQRLDNSSFMRVGPMVLYIWNLSPLSLSGLLGHGAAASSDYFGDQLGVLAGQFVTTLQVGFIPAFFYDYGLLTAGAFLFFLKRLGGFRLVSPEAAMVLLVLFNANFNTQLIWFVATVLCITRAPLAKAVASPLASAMPPAPCTETQASN